MVTTPGQIHPLAALGLAPTAPAPRRRIIMALAGEEKTGKTRFTMTATKPLGYMNIDKQAHNMLKLFRDAGHEIWEHEVPQPTEIGIAQYAPVWADYKAKLAGLYRYGLGSVAIDTETDQYRISRLARFGKIAQVTPDKYPPLYAELNAMIQDAYNALEMTTIFLRKMGDESVQDKKSGKREVKGYRDIAYAVQMNASTIRYDYPDGGMPAFGILIHNSTDAPQLTGTKLWTIPPGRLPVEDPRHLTGIDDCNFPTLLSKVFPG